MHVTDDEDDEMAVYEEIQELAAADPFELQTPPTGRVKRS